VTAPTPDHGLTPALVSELSGGSIASNTPGLVSAIDAAVDAIRAYCGWHVWPQRRDLLILDGEGGRELSMPTLHVVAVHEVTDCDRVLDDTEFEWSRVGDIKRVDRSWSTRWRGITVELDHGYSDLPDDLSDVVADVLRDRLNSSQGDHVTSVKLDAAEVAFANPYAARGSSSVGVRRDLSGYAALNRYRIWPAT